MVTMKPGLGKALNKYLQCTTPELSHLQNVAVSSEAFVAIYMCSIL